ncbi:trypsin-like peptidase domain-containing protein [Evansella tamaricis]|uniref:Trypsin-like peptidase domain-containing protein n=1 Tax=Evansella tamaricis TaxID=2069301 RepID=A0ABS6JIV5_9BACI|nr:trypsin-like peptidase domain-containing protein [Evansella tamaricis]MBU9713614.1 trypsin-like peptidase domain-containing protein [Evansella tamaricis]
MYCPNCGKPLEEKTRFCPHCGRKRKQSKFLFTLLFLTAFLSGIFMATNFFSENPDPPEERIASYLEERKIEKKNQITSIPAFGWQDREEAQKRELTELIADAQEAVYTIYTSYNQGSGFLYNDSGAVVTNAHVVEGDPLVQVRTNNGTEYKGTVIGYSNETDVAVILVPDLAGRKPFPKNTEEPVMIGEEVIALGSPLGLENTATIGYITGSNRDFIIDSFIYENLYQISAPISPGSSGGPLLSKSAEKIIAINSAQNIHDTSIGFSIPLYQVEYLIQSWIDEPMNEEAILSQYYNSYGDYFFGESWDHNEGYFENGDFSEEEYYDYWEPDAYDFWEEFDYEYWENVYEQWLEKWGIDEWDNDDWDMEFYYYWDDF